MNSELKVWKAVKKNLPNLHVLTVGSREVGFIEKPQDTATDKNAWRAFKGVPGVFLGHRSTKAAAQNLVEQSA